MHRKGRQLLSYFFHQFIATLWNSRSQSDPVGGRNPKRQRNKRSARPCCRSNDVSARDDPAVVSLDTLEREIATVPASRS